MNNYLSDEALKELIAATEEEPLLHPPGAFKNDILEQIRRRKKRRKDRQLFSYSMKVIVAAAAALGILLMMPDTMRSEEQGYSGWWQQNMRQYGQSYGTPEENAENAVRKNDGGGFADWLNRQMDEYCNRLNTGLDRLIRMEDYDDEKEEK
ncbi:MAG: hypothetical protein NC318_09770 [Blautia sp.]|nr:hypothetical protein [Lachnoclostridium sp.]MCM1211878.1 hypothetical protein [Blautia sp.]